MNKLVIKRIIWVSLAVVLIGSTMMLIVNRGFEHSYFTPTFKLQVVGDAKDQILDDYAFDSRVSKVNRPLGVINFQGVTADEVEQVREGIVQSDGVVEAKVSYHVQLLPLGIGSRVINFIAAVTLIVLGFSYFSFIRKTSGKSKIQMSLSIALIFVTIYTGSFIHLGILSAASTMYELTDLSFLGLLISLIWAISIVYFNLKDILEWGDIKLRSVVIDLHRGVRQSLRNSFILWGALVLTIGIGLGAKAIVDLGLLWAGVLIMTLSIAYLPELYLYAFSFPVVKLQGRRSRKKSKQDKAVQSSAETNEHNTSSKKTTTSRKLSRKSRPRNKK